MEQTKIRESGCELLKIIGIILIVFSHVVQTLDNDFYTLLGFNDYHIKLSEPTTNIQILIIVLLRYAGIVGNWIFFMSSAWYLLDKKITNFKKVVRMLIEIFVISISFLGITLLFTDFNITDFYIKRSFFPTFFKNNWYTTYYIIFCFIFPILNKLIDLMNKKIHLIILRPIIKA